MEDVISAIVKDILAKKELRNLDKEKSWMDGAHTQKTIDRYHEKCYDKIIKNANITK